MMAILATGGFTSGVELCTAYISTWCRLDQDCHAPLNIMHP
jgi:hypothetical protein